MEVIDTAAMYARFAWRLVRFLKTPWTAEAAEAAVREGLRTREERFLRVLREQVYANPRSPYNRLLEWAGCELGDIASGLKSDGLEETLRRLYHAGVYVTFPEFKGYAPIRRGSRELVAGNPEFDNRRGRPDFFSQTSGTSGAPVRVPIYLDELASRASSWTLARRALNLDRHRCGILFPIGGTGFRVLLIFAKAGMRPERWFSITDPGLPGLAFRYRWSGRLVNLWSTLIGCRLPEPETVDVQKLDPVVQWCRDRAPVCVIALPSSAVRTCLRATEIGVRLPETCLLVGGEALTPERRAAIREAGAFVGGIYAAIEGGTIALGCPNSAAHEEEDYHVRMEDFGVIATPRPVQTGSPLLITCLTLSAGKILLNTELGDTADVHEERCGCYFETLGMRQHLRSIRSTSKFTAEGMTLLKSDVNHVLEAVLPKKYGGVPGDYQLVQRRGPDGMEFLDLWISPELSLGANGEVVNTFLDELARLDMSYRIVTDVWGKAGTVRIVRSRPVRAAGKDPSVQTDRS